MKKNTIKKREFIIGILGFILGIALMFFITRVQVQYQKNLTVKILKNSIGSMEAFQELSNSCADAYKTATTCVSNLQSCDIAEESKKLDEYDTRRKYADTIIDWANRDMKQIIKEVSSNR